MISHAIYLFFHFQVANIESASIGLVITIILTTSISIIVIAIALFICKRHKQYEGKFTYVLSGNTKRFNPDSDLKSQISSIAHDYKRELGRTTFEILEEIGNGNFGKVFKGELKALKKSCCKSTVAIKSICDNVDDNEIKNFLYEIKIMAHIDPHLNLVSMIGCCTSELEKTRDVWLLLEFCDYGDLKHYLITNKNNILLGVDFELLNSRCLVLWAYHIAKGMEYLHKSKIMHGDLAARNVLLDTAPLNHNILVAKVADFGLSKKFYDNITYEKENRVLVPWKWMALEYLKNEILSLQSDVWSYGVLFWEILSFGTVPYGQIEYSDLLQKLENGYRLSCPSEVHQICSWSPERLYARVAKSCFIEDSNERGSFVDIASILEDELSVDEKNQYKTINDTYQSNNAKDYLNITKTKHI